MLTADKRAQHAAVGVFAAMASVIFWSLEAWLPALLAWLFVLNCVVFLRARFELTRAAALCVAPVLVLALAAAFVPLGGPNHPWRVSLVVLTLFGVACAAWAYARGGAVPSFGRRARVLLVIAMGAVGFESWSVFARPGPRTAAELAPSIAPATTASQTPSHLAVGDPSAPATIKAPPPRVSFDPGAYHGNGAMSFDRSYVVKRTPRTGRYVVELIESGRPGLFGAYGAPERFLADREWGELPYAFAFVGRSYSAPIALLVVAYVGFAISAWHWVRARRRSVPREAEGPAYREAPPSPSARPSGSPWVGLVASAPLLAWRVVAVLLS